MCKISDKKSLWIGIILLVVGCISFVYWSTQKEVWFCDEIYSYESANGFEQSWPATYVAQWMTGEDVEAFFAADWDTLSFNSISNVLYNDHVPLYFWLFRMVSLWGFKGSGTIWIGLSINLVFYLLYLAIGYCWLSKLSNNSVVAGVSMFIVGVVNKVMLAQTTMLRMYMMLAWAELLLVLIGLRLLREVKNEKMKGMTFLYLFVFSVFGLLTHYDYWIFYAITAAAFCMWMLILAFKKQKKNFWKTKEFKYVLAWVGNFVASLLTTIAIFPYCRWNLNKGKGQTALHSLVVFSKEKVEHILWGFERLSASFFGENIPTIVGLLIMFGCIAGGAFILYKKKETDKLIGMVLIVLISLGYQFIVCFTMPAVAEERYLWGPFSLIHLYLVWCIYLVLDAICCKVKDIKVRDICKKAVCVFVAVVLVISQLLIVDGGNGVAYLFHPQKDVELLEEHSNIPWLVFGPTVGVYSYYDWLMPEEICFLSLDMTEEDAQAVREIKDTESFVLYTYQDYEEQAVAFFEQEMQKDLTSKELTKSTNLTVYVISEERASGQ